MMAKRVALIGCGRWGRHILRDLVSLGCTVTVVARSEQSRRRAIEGRASDVVSSVAELPEVDGMVVATPTITHADVLEAALDWNVPIFVEKPMASDPARAALLAERAPDRLFVMDKWRYHPGIEALAEIARSEELGPVVGLRTTRVQRSNPHPDVDCIWNLAPHDLAIALEVLGEIPRPRIAFAERIGSTPTGLLGILGENPWFVFEVSSSHNEYRREIRLYCRDGIAFLSDAYSKHVEVIRASEPSDPVIEPVKRPISTELPLLGELRAFVEHVEGGPPPRSSAAEGAKVVAVIAELRALAGLEPKESGR